MFIKGWKLAWMVCMKVKELWTFLRSPTPAGSYLDTSNEVTKRSTKASRDGSLGTRELYELAGKKTFWVSPFLKLIQYTKYTNSGSVRNDGGYHR